MDNLAEYLGGGSLAVVAVLAWKVASLSDEVKSLRQSRHEHGNRFAACEVRLADVERRLDKINGEARR